MAFIDDQIKHRVQLEKLKNQSASDIIKRFILIYPELSKILIELDGKKADIIIRELNKIVDKNIKAVNNELTKISEQVIKYEYLFQTALISKYTEKKLSSKVINSELARKLVFDSLMAGEFYEKTLNRFGQSFKDSVEKSVRLGIVNGQTTKQISNAVKTTVNIKRNQLDSITRTVTQSVVNTANEQVYKNNSIEKYKYLAILDARTTDICKSLNNKIFEVGKGPIPPQHFNCRSFTVPVYEDLEDKNYDTYNEFYKEQEDKTGIKSKSEDKFETSDKITLNDLESKL